MGELYPIPNQPAAVATMPSGRCLLIADYHAGYEAYLRWEHGVDVPDRAGERRQRLLSLIDECEPDRLIILGDLMHSIGDPGTVEREEIRVLFEHLPSDLGVVIVKGNHDGAIERWLIPAAETDESDRSGDEAVVVEQEISIVPGEGKVIDNLGVCHGHTWPAAELLAAEVLCCGHEHPCVRLEDEVGGHRLERVWIRGRVSPAGFVSHSRYDDTTIDRLTDAPATTADRSASTDNSSGTQSDAPASGNTVPRQDAMRLVVFPAFNSLVGGTWVNQPEQEFLTPFLPDGIVDGQAYLLDGTRLGGFRTV